MRISGHISIILGAIIAQYATANAQQDKYADIRERLEVCAGCHGELGASKDPEVPILAGQEYYYLYVQLKDFKAGRRASVDMEPIVEDMEKKDMKALAQFFSEQTWPNIPYRASPEQASIGATATTAGQCVACHLGAYDGNSRVPRLAGQYPEYLERTMDDFKNKVRLNSPAKGSLMISYSDEDIAAMAAFLGNL